MNLTNNEKLNQQWKDSIHDPARKPVFDAMIDTINEAHRIKPSSWALLLTQSGSAVVNIAASAVMTLRPGKGGDFLVEGPTSAFDTLNDTFPNALSLWRDEISKVRFTNDGHWLETLTTYREQHFGVIHQLVSEVSTNAQRWQEHCRPLVLELRAAGFEVPDPHYVQSYWNRPDWVMVPPPTGYWRIGYSAEDALRESTTHGVISIPDPAGIGDLRALSSEAQDLERTLSGQLGASNAENLLWLFRDMKTGDRIVANYRTELIALGDVSGDYDYQNSTHIRTVNWNEPVAISSFIPAADQIIKGPRSTGLTPIEESFFQALSSPQETDNQGTSTLPAGVSPPTGDISRRISEHFASRGLTYTDAQIAEFYTALQTKGFVVLSGISGTGKSKIAQHFTELLPDAVVQEVAGPDPVSTDEGLSFKVSKSENWSAVPADQSSRFPRIPTNTKFDVRFIFEGGAYNGSYKLRILAGGRPTLYFTFGQALTQKLRSSVDESGTIYAQFMPAPNPTSLPEVRLSTSKPDRVRDQIYEDIVVSNTLFLSVRPDWRDGTSLLGYYNPLTQTYEWTEFLRFVLNAVDNMQSDNPVAWFVILDEMNLAHVEYYFADLLSVLESGRDADGFTVEPIRLTYPDTVVNDTPPAEIRLPPNLVIIGTVNMDETTHAFSPKVLDRAFTMELSTVDFATYQPRRTPDDAALSPEQQAAMLAAFTINGWPAINKNRIADYIAAHPEIRDALHRLNTGLARYRFHFGYRVFDEIVQFLANADANRMFESPGDAFDSAVFMKILPKFSGSEGRVGRPLQDLHEWAKAPFGVSGAPLTRTLARAAFMQQRLEVDGFVTAF